MQEEKEKIDGYIVAPLSNNKKELTNKELTNKEILDYINNDKFEKALQDLTKKYTKKIIPIVTDDKFIESQNAINNLVNSIAPQIKELTENYVKYFDKMINSLNIGKLISDYIVKFEKTKEDIFKSLNYHKVSRLGGYDCNILNKYYWVVPYEYDYNKVKDLVKYKIRKSFEQYMLKYFNDKRVNRLFNDLKKQFKEKDKKELLKQIKHSYFNGDYSICITSLMTLFDGSTLILIEPNSFNQHKSHNVMRDLLEIMGNKTDNDVKYELFLRVNIINNFIIKLYPRDFDLKLLRKKRLLIRQANSHGVRYFNDKINVLRLLNAMYFCNEVINDINLKEQFTSSKGSTKFSLVKN